MPTNYSGRIAAIVVVVLLALWAIFPKPGLLFRSDVPWGEKINLKPGIDMQGGTSLLYEIKPPSDEQYVGNLSSDVMAALKERVDPNGTRNLVWRPQGDTRLEIQMPATTGSQEAFAAREQLIAVENELNASNITVGEVKAAIETAPAVEQRAVPVAEERARRLLSGAPHRLPKGALPATERRAAQLARLASGDPARTALFDELTGAWDKLQQARKDKDAEAAADAQIAYNQALARVDQTNLRIPDLSVALELKGADRQKALDAIRARLAGSPTRTASLDKYIAAHDAFAKVRDLIDDVADLKRKLKGAGVLQFHILADETASPAEISTMEQRLASSGPRSQGGDRLKWFEVDRDEKSIGGPTGVYNGKTYALAWITDEKSLDHRESKPAWALKRAYAQAGELGDRRLAFEFDATGGELFSQLTGANLQRTLAAILDGKVISAATIQSRIGAVGEISSNSTAGGFSQADIEYMTSTFNAGSLKATLADEPISERTVGPQLGKDNLRRGFAACMFGLVVVAVFLIGYYYLSGVVATIAVLLNMVIILGVMAGLNATFTLAGIAGIVLTIGMAVDANVLIFERLREEQVRGLSLRMALRNAYDRAFSAILDGNITTGITAAVLYLLGSEEVKGFGLTLLIGIAASMFTALFVTKTLFGILIDKFDIKSLGSLPLTFPKWDRILRPDIDWMSKAWMFYTFSVVVMIAGLTAFGVRLAQEDAGRREFAKGTSVQFELTEPMEQQAVRELIEVESRQRPDVLPAPSVVSIGSDDRNYEVVTPNDNSAAVRAAIIERRGSRLKVEQPSKFEGVGTSLRDATAAGTDYITPITSVTQEVAGFVPARCRARLGGVAIVLKNLDPPLAPEQVRKRIERQKLQGQNTAVSGGTFDVEEAPGKGPGGENTVVVLASDPAFAYDAIDEIKKGQWQSVLVGPLWQTINDGVNKPAELQKVGSFGPQVARETKLDAMLALSLSIVAIMAYIWVRFGNSKYGTATVVALLHDTLFTLAAVGLAHYLAELSFFREFLLIEPFRVNLTLVAAVLTVMGYSMNDTVVVFDRIRENRGRFGVLSRKIINDSINQTLSRTLLTGGTTILTILIMYIFGGSGIHGFTFALLVGIVVGTYSSIAIASPIVLFGTKVASGVSSDNKNAIRKTEALQGVGAT